MIRLRVSTLEDFRRVVTTDYGDETALTDRLKRGQWTEGPASWQMRAGTAWHKVLAEPQACVRYDQAADGAAIEFMESGGYRFSLADYGRAAAHVGLGQTYGGDLVEVTGHKTFDIGGLKVEVEGTADLVRGLVIQDHKTKFSTPDARDYELSLQWRFYLLIHGTACFRYNLFHFADPDGNSFCQLRDILSVRFWPYPGIEQECMGWVRRFVEWADGRGLLELTEVRDLIAAKE